jgi:integrase
MISQVSAPEGEVQQVHPPKIPRQITRMAAPKKTAQGTWRVQIEINGQRESGTFDTKREADEWNARRAIELKAAGKHGPGSGKTLSDVLRRYSEEESQKKRGSRWEIIRLAAFEKEIHESLPVKKRIQLLTSEDIGRWRDARLKTTARGSVLRDLGLLSSVLETARLEWKWIKINPVRDVRKPSSPNHRERVIRFDETRKMLRALGYTFPVCTVSGSVAVCFLTALASGMRAGELTKLRWQDVKTDHVVLPITKNGKRRDVPLTPVAQRLIAQMKGWDAEMVFALKATTLDALFRRARKRAGLADFVFHDARHTAATALAQKLDVLTLCKVFGWSNTKQALTYFNPSASNIARRLA